MRGRKPIPTELHIARGDPSHLRKLDDKLAGEPKPLRGLPNCPPHLEGLAREQYERWKQELEMMNLAYRPDGPALEGAAVMYARAVEADELVKKYGLVIAVVTTSPSGTQTKRMKPNPAIAIANASWVAARSFMSEFGLTPVARTRLKIDESNKSQMDLMALLTKPRKNRRPPPAMPQGPPKVQ